MGVRRSQADTACPLFKGLPAGAGRVDVVTGIRYRSWRMAFMRCASSDTCPYAASANEEKKIYTLQFHPEVRHSVYGNDILKNFVFEICEAQANWSMHDFIDAQVEKIRAQVKDDKVLLALVRRRRFQRGCGFVA